MIEIIEEIADFKVKRNYLLDKPKGVRGRSSDNKKILGDLNWQPSVKLKDGLELTYQWIFNQIKSGDNTSKFVKS
jgi:nucleoside-diphosphate-sugar epimerase